MNLRNKMLSEWLKLNNINRNEYKKCTLLKAYYPIFINKKKEEFIIKYKKSPDFNDKKFKRFVCHACLKKRAMKRIDATLFRREQNNLEKWENYIY